MSGVEVRVWQALTPLLMVPAQNNRASLSLCFMGKFLGRQDAKCSKGIKSLLLFFLPIRVCSVCGGGVGRGCVYELKQSTKKRKCWSDSGMSEKSKAKRSMRLGMEPKKILSRRC